MISRMIHTITIINHYTTLEWRKLKGKKIEKGWGMGQMIKRIVISNLAKLA